MSKQKDLWYCVGCGKFKQSKFYAGRDHRYCKSCESDKPERKKVRRAPRKIPQ